MNRHGGRQTGRAHASRRSALRATLARATTALLLGGCLVTQEVDVAAINSPPVISVLSPQTFTQVPSYDDPACPAARHMRFVVVLRDADVSQLLNVQLYVNGRAFEEAPRRLYPSAPSGPQTNVEWCVPHVRFTEQPCNQVQVVATSSYDKLTGREPLRDYEPDLARQRWFVLGPWETYYDAAPGDCRRLFVDGGLP